MRKSIISCLALAAILSGCKDQKQEAVVASPVEQAPKETIAPVSDAMMESGIIYEANIRQYSQEGTFDAFTKDIPQLKELGVKIIWLMPVFPISETKRKATGGDDSKYVSEMPESEQSKYLGSYYAVSDYTKINPEYGTIEDFRELVKTAHDNGMYVILDWVPNHTGWDHHWLTEHPDYFVKNNDGEITDPLNEDGTSKGWGDVAQLDYSNPELRKAMINDMMYWVAEEDVDGFRCDHVDPTPIEFWEEAIGTLEQKKELFMLAESDKPRFLKDDLFDMVYGWRSHHMMNHMAQGKNTVADWNKLMVELDSMYPGHAIIMNFVTNHDENSWAGTVDERLGDASELMTALAYMTPGMPLIYSGQEYGLDHRLKFFEKDSIPKTKGEEWELLMKLAELKLENVALNGGKQAADYKTVEFDNPNVLVFKRNKNGQTVTFVGNISAEEQSFTNVLPGKFKDFLVDKKIEFKEDSITLKPWEFKILVD